MRIDPRVIRATTLKLGHRPEDMVDTGEMTVSRDHRKIVGMEMEGDLEARIEKMIRDGL